MSFNIDDIKDQQNRIISRQLGCIPYQTSWDDMRTFTASRDDSSYDEIWWCEHPAVYTLGQAGKIEHLLQPSAIPVVQTDRGGQITFHGPGQLLAYPLIDLKRKNIGIKAFIHALEDTVLELLSSQYHLNAHIRCGAPGVYIDDAKICSIGIRIKKHCSFHGIALNVAMDLRPFTHINPCGYANQRITQLKDFGITDDIWHVMRKWQLCFYEKFGYTSNSL